MRVLVACEFSGTVRRAFAARGHEAWSCDLLPAEDASPFHIVGDALDALRQPWDLQALMDADVPHICVENPVSVISSRIRPADQTIQPWQFGHGETKATCLWLKNLPKLRPTQIVDGRDHRVHRMPPGPNRWRERSRTFQGIAAAMAEQWSDLTTFTLTA